MNRPRLLAFALLAGVFSYGGSNGRLSASVATLANIAVVHIQSTTLLRLTANGPFVWRDASGRSDGASFGSPLHLKLYGVSLVGSPGKSSQETSTELGTLRLEQDGDNVQLTLTSSGGGRYRVRSGRSPNAIEIVAE